MKRGLVSVLVLIALVSEGNAISFGGAPQILNYQGRLTDATGTPLSDGPHSIEIRLWADSSSSNIAYLEWDSGPLVVTTDKGLFAVKLGTPPQPVLTYLPFYDSLLFLGITVGADPEISPRTRLTSVPYAMSAENAVSASTAGTAYTLVPSALPAAGSVNVVMSSTTSTTPVTLGQFTVTAPGPGILQVNVSGAMWLNADATSANALTAYFQLGLCTSPASAATCNGTYTEYYVQDADNTDGLNVTPAFSINGSFPIGAAGPYTFYINANSTNSSWALSPWGQTVANVLFVPASLSISSPTAANPNPQPKQQ